MPDNENETDAEAGPYVVVRAQEHDALCAEVLSLREELATRTEELAQTEYKHARTARLAKGWRDERDAVRGQIAALRDALVKLRSRWDSAAHKAPACSAAIAYADCSNELTAALAESEGDTP